MGLRLCGHLLIGSLPDRGLGEAVECLGDLFDHYSTPQLDPNAHLAPRVTVLDASLGATYERPEFYAAED
jgi:hypothetical protein